MTRKLPMLLFVVALAVLAAFSLVPLVASDHDDGEADLKGRALNITDLYAFRERDQNPGAADGDLVFIMNVNPRSLARQQYYFSPNAAYELHFDRAGNNDATPTGQTDVLLRFEFGAPTRDGSQRIKLTAVRDGQATEVESGTLRSTPLAMAATPNVARVSVGGATFSVFAGLREDPFFFDVEQYFRPAINEGLIVTNDFLNALNSVGPDFEAAALAGKKPAADIAGPIVAEAKKTLMAVGNDDRRATALILAFLPDVMRIDTSGPSGYANALNAKGSPIRGRKISDDVIDITLTVVTNGAIKSDNVSFAGPNAGGTGHKPLLDAFPYLAEPN